ncbi:hypothetical protein BDZ94DRAFT_1314745 [Collybia nuda]|uniref:Fungal-type protein kinase domain-containing protein n=1 Tax=Collybia nuda TaxID=64659 RepID=A0A9P5XW99_9AGAR|nr:hypothetical protein BDZ94DRAFT_1314745 [Collybia nuda]
MSSNTANPAMSGGSSPIKRTLESSTPFTSSAESSSVLKRGYLAKEMEGNWIGPMSVRDFLKEFLTIPPGTPPPSRRSGLFRKLKPQTKESGMYRPFIKAISQPKANLIRGFKIINTSSHPDINSLSGRKIKPDPSMYRSEVATSIKITQFDKLELHFEFKLEDKNDPFRDPPSPDTDRIKWEFEAQTIQGRDCRGQLSAYLAEWCSRQHLAFAFTVLILGSSSRLIRWDRSAAIVSEKFDYLTNGQPLDNTVHVANTEETEIAYDKMKNQKSKLDWNVIIFTIQVDGQGREFLGWSPMANGELLLGRATRPYPVWDIQEHALRFLKDSWRWVHFERESDILRLLNGAGVQIVPQLIGDGDIEGHWHTNLSHTFAANSTDETTGLRKISWKYGVYSILQRVHHRFVGKDIGLHLIKFKTSKDMMQVVYDAFIAHKEAYERCGTLHGDISNKNVMMKENGTGFLNDWDLAKRVTKDVNQVPQEHERMVRSMISPTFIDINKVILIQGTWQFTSTLNLLKPGKLHNVQDDIESFFHLVLYHGIKCLHHAPLANAHTTMTTIFDECSVDPNGTYRGGEAKYAMFMNRRHITPDFIFIGNAPLNYWLSFVMGAIKQWVGFEMPPLTANHSYLQDPYFTPFLSQTNYNRPEPSIEPSLPTLKDHKKFAEIWELVLGHPKWPENDKTSDQVPPITATNLAASPKRV